MKKKDPVVPEKLTLESRLKFRCHKGIQCFTKCCSNIDILLTPYDVIRLKNRLNLSSEEFLTNYTFMKTDEKSSHSYAMLLMSDDKEKKCIFLREDGCSVYTDRPSNCRYYPVGQGIFKKDGKEGPEEEEFYFIVREEHCLGFNEDKTWTIASWRDDQGVDLYDSMNRDWKAVQLRKNLPGHDGLDEKKQFQFYMASYDMDRFRRFVFESNFLKIFDIDDETVERIRNDEVELMKFGVKYIKTVMMLEESLKLREGAEQYRKKN